MWRSLSILRLQECCGGRQKAYTNPPLRADWVGPTSWMKLDMTVLRSAARDVAHCSLQMTMSTHLTTGITHASTISSDCGLLLLQLGLLFNSARACVIWCRHGWSNRECRNSVNSYGFWCSISVSKVVTIIQLITYPLTSLILRYARNDLQAIYGLWRRSVNDWFQSHFSWLNQQFLT